MAIMQTDELAEYLNALQREECYRVDAVMKESAFETTQRVMFVGRNGAEQGPFVRKYIKRDSGLGSVYGRICEAQRNGRRFRFIPRIIDCYALGEDDVVVMEYVYGETLQDAVYRCDPSMAFAADVFPRLCDAVLELHEAFDAPIIHRDLKPTNIMISRDSLTIIDLGIARFYRDGAGEDTCRFGTRAYAPPEQFGFGQTTVRSDVYALGMLLYFCLVEKTPDAHVREKGFFDPRIPEQVRMVLVRATELDPARRFAGVRELRDAFCAAATECGLGGIVAGSACASGAHPAVSHAGSGAVRGQAPADSGFCPPVPACVSGASFIEGASVRGAAASGGSSESGPRSIAFAQGGFSASRAFASQAVSHAGIPGDTVVPHAHGGLAEPGARIGRGGRMGSDAGDAARSDAFFRRAVLSARSAVRRLSDRIPLPLCVAWNVLVLGCAGILLIGCVWAALFPNETDAAYPLWFLVVEYLLFAASNVVVLTYVLLDKRRAYAIFARLPRMSLLRQWAVFGGYFIASLAALVAFHAVALPYFGG